MAGQSLGVRSIDVHFIPKHCADRRVVRKRRMNREDAKNAKRGERGDVERAAATTA